MFQFLFFGLTLEDTSCSLSRCVKLFRKLLYVCVFSSTVIEVSYHHRLQSVTAKMLDIIYFHMYKYRERTVGSICLLKDRMITWVVWGCGMVICDPWEHI